MKTKKKRPKIKMSGGKVDVSDWSTLFTNDMSARLSMAHRECEKLMKARLAEIFDDREATEAVLAAASQVIEYAVRDGACFMLGKDPTEIVVYLPFENLKDGLTGPHFRCKLSTLINEELEMETQNSPELRILSAELGRLAELIDAHQIAIQHSKATEGGTQQ